MTHPAVTFFHPFATVPLSTFHFIWGIITLGCRKMAQNVVIKGRENAMETEAVKRWLEKRNQCPTPDDEFLTMLEELHIPVERITAQA